MANLIIEPAQPTVYATYKLHTFTVQPNDDMVVDAIDVHYYSSSLYTDIVIDVFDQLFTEPNQTICSSALTLLTGHVSRTTGLSNVASGTVTHAITPITLIAGGTYTFVIYSAANGFNSKGTIRMLLSDDPLSTKYYAFLPLGADVITVYPYTENVAFTIKGVLVSDITDNSDTILASKTCQYIRPESENNPDAANYEYFLAWIGTDGGVYCWLFEDFNLKKSISSEIFNTKNENISKLYKDAKRSVRLVAEDLSENEFDVISGITKALTVRRYYKDGTFEPLAIMTDSFEKQKSQFRYNFEIEVMEIEDKILR